MESAIDLEVVAELFQRWRSQRTSTREPIPDRLWRLVASLCSQHNKSAICNGLGLGGSQLKHHVERVTSKDDNGFVLATPQEEGKEPQAPVLQSALITMVVTGTHRRLELSVDVDSLEAVLPHIGGLL